MKILSGKKTFGDVAIGDDVYILDPKDQKVKGTQVISIQSPPPKTPNRTDLIQIEFYALIRHELVTEEKLKNAQEYGTPNTTDSIIVKKDLESVMLMSKIPTVCATTRARIENWMAQTKKG